MNAACTDEPAIIVVPKTDLDVSVALKAAKNSGLPLRFIKHFLLSFMNSKVCDFQCKKWRT